MYIFAMRLARSQEGSRGPEGQQQELQRGGEAGAGGREAARGAGCRG